MNSFNTHIEKLKYFILIAVLVFPLGCNTSKVFKGGAIGAGAGGAVGGVIGSRIGQYGYGSHHWSSHWRYCRCINRKIYGQAGRRAG